MHNLLKSTLFLSRNNYIVYKLKDYFTNGHKRSIKAKRNIIASFGLRGFSILVSFLLVPLTLNYLNASKYGIWLILSSIFGWVGFLDFGLGLGLRNKLAEALTFKDYKLAKIYVSTTYAIISLITGGIFIIFLLINPFLNWSYILNTPPEMARELSWTAVIVFTFFSLRFVLELIGVILTADQLPSVKNGFASLENLTAFIAIYFIAKYTSGNLLYISITYSAAPVLILTIASYYFFSRKYNFIKPNLKSVDFNYFKSLANLGINFFILQIGVVIVFLTDNMIITRILGPAEVTPYNIAFKFFGFPIMIFSIVLTPFWSAYTEAYSVGDMKWIKTIVRKLVKTWLVVVLGVIFLLSISKYFYLMWVGTKIYVPFLLSIFMGLFVIISTWTNIFIYFVNGVGKIKLQTYCAIFGLIINIPISIFFAKNLNMGSAGVILGTCFSIIMGSILIPIQYLKITTCTAKGIWDK